METSLSLLEGTIYELFNRREELQDKIKVYLRLPFNEKKIKVSLITQLEVYLISTEFQIKDCLKMIKEEISIN